ncbi:OLC1v1013612C1 [Oldenlandia corymbosa var. corymbosa]|uniref:OLC1v1013612C1 n=1 Tax=Oldenlandia corymbosa var. corymbosa TaxID=529605 RepID=A0AAV1DZI6_OLDCO|nr:OLC1v1013612C1 [Oldenlandia corymbosa var. corymbosa]
MSSSPKRAKIANLQEDRLSSLPDCILCHILSFMSTKDAARTSILSTTWKYLYLGVQNIDLEENIVEEDEEPGILQPQGSRNRSAGFVGFVNRRLMLNGTSNITDFRLKCRELPEAYVSLWLTALLLRAVKVLEIEVLTEQGNAQSQCPPTGFFRSQTLVVLKLCGPNIVFKIPEFVCLPSLKVLHLKYLDMQFESDKGILAEGSPLLEDLRLDRIRLPKKQWSIARPSIVASILRIALPKLKRLEFIMPREDNRVYDLYLYAPHLQHLECSLTEEYNPSNMFINSFNSEYLISAKVSPSGNRVAFTGWQQVFVRALAKFGTLKELHVSKRFLEADTGTCSPPENEPPSCLVQCLKEIRIRKFEGNKDEFSAVQYFLQHGAVLERMIIQRSSYQIKEWPEVVLRRLLMLARRSSKCQIELN